jgi:ABC-2 type transport system permease protein
VSNSPLRSILVIGGNNLRRLLRDPIMLFTTLALPFMVILVVGIALGGSQNRLNTGVVSHAGDSVAGALVTSLKSSSALQVTTFDSDAALDRAVRLGQVDAGIVIPDGYGPALEDGRTPVVRFVTTPDQTSAASIRSVFSSILSGQTGVIQAAEFSHAHTGRPQAAEQQRAQGLTGGIAVPSVQSTAVGAASGQALGFDYTAPSNLVLFIVITSLTSAAALIDTRVRGITSRMFAMPLTRATILFGELLGRFLVAAAQAVVILLFSSLVFRINWGDPAGVALVTLALCVFGGALGMAVGFGARTMAQAISFGPPLGVVLGMLGGCMWPLSIVGSPLRAVGHVTPHAWAMDAYLKLINDRAGVSAVLPEVGVVAGFAVLVLLIAFFLAGRRRTV